jgi:hypothetical protein
MFKKIQLAVFSLIAVLCLCVQPLQDSRAQAFAGGCASVRGSFTATVTGYASPPTGTIQFRVTNGCQVTLWATTAITGTSNAATMTMTGLPYNIWSSVGAIQLVPQVITDNSADVIGCVSVPNQSGTLTFSNSGACTGVVTSSGTKAIPAGWTFTYNLL